MGNPAEGFAVLIVVLAVGAILVSGFGRFSRKHSPRNAKHMEFDNGGLFSDLVIHPQELQEVHPGKRPPRSSPYNYYR